MTSRALGARPSLAAVAVLIVSWYVAATVPVRAQAPDIGTAEQRESGKKLYLKYCSQCHGEKGDGEGYASPHLYPKPRDFTSGKFKIRTTPSGKLPTDADLHHIIKVGMPYTSMPAWPHLTDAEIDNLVAYVKSFSPEFAKPDMAVYTFQRNSDGATVQSTDPGRGIRSGNFADLNKFKTPNLRGLAARAPYLHNGIAGTLLDVVRHYEVALGFVFTASEEADLVAFLTAL